MYHQKRYFREKWTREPQGLIDDLTFHQIWARIRQPRVSITTDLLPHFDIEVDGAVYVFKYNETVKIFYSIRKGYHFNLLLYTSGKKYSNEEIRSYCILYCVHLSWQIE